jgi:pimeloyl-ACP methyl ester carboxylesterase
VTRAVRAGFAVAAALALGAAGSPRDARAVELRTVPTRAGVTETFLLVTPPTPPAASVILFAGGHGGLALSPRGIGWGGGNFLVRTRERFAAHGLLVAVLDAPSDRRDLTGFRTSAQHAADVKAVIAALRATAAVPVWLVGTSMGSVSAANAAARLQEDGPDGLVLSSSVTRTSRMTTESLGMVKLERITVPTLIVHHREDACLVTPFADATLMVKELARAPRRELIGFAGGEPARSDPCEAMSAHGYLGLEAEVVTAIADWIKASR